MNISINGMPVQGLQHEAANLEDVIVDLSRTAVPPNHLVSSIMVNGKLFSEVYPGQAREISIQKICDIVVDTVPVEKVAAASLKDSAVFIDKIAASVLAVSELFRMYDEMEAHRQYAEILESLRALLQFIDNIKKTIDWNFNDSDDGKKTIMEAWNRLLDIIDEMKGVQDEGDLILLADLLEYELFPALLSWKNIFEKKYKQYTPC